MVDEGERLAVSGERELPSRAEDRVREVLETVLDPEVPVLSIVELGIVREVAVEGDTVTVTVTPTYSGCPAMHAIEAEIRATLAAAGFPRVELKTVYAPAWTTDWMSDPAKEKLRAYGIAPPGGAAAPLVQRDAPRRAACPFCGSSHNSLESEFGATACKALFVCHSCQQPFEHFKAF